MDTIYWLGIGYACVMLGIGIYLASLGIKQKHIIQKLEDIEGNIHER